MRNKNQSNQHNFVQKSGTVHRVTIAYCSHLKPPLAFCRDLWNAGKSRSFSRHAKTMAWHARNKPCAHILLLLLTCSVSLPLHPSQKCKLLFESWLVVGLEMIHQPHFVCSGIDYLGIQNPCVLFQTAWGASIGRRALSHFHPQTHGEL